MTAVHATLNSHTQQKDMIGQAVFSSKLREQATHSSAVQVCSYIPGMYHDCIASIVQVLFRWHSNRHLTSRKSYGPKPLKEDPRNESGPSDHPLVRPAAHSSVAVPILSTRTIGQHRQRCVVRKHFEVRPYSLQFVIRYLVGTGNGFDKLAFKDRDRTVHTIPGRSRIPLCHIVSVTAPHTSNNAV